MTERATNSSESAGLQEKMRRRDGVRAVILFVNFFLIILAYYQVKPASRSLFVEYLGADRLPYVWIGTALTLWAIIGVYNRIVERHDRFNVVLGTCVSVAIILVLFRVLLNGDQAVTAVAFYIFVDIFSVVLVEQFWSLTDSVYATKEGKRWFGFVGTGGLLGGVVGGELASSILDYTSFSTRDLLLVAAAFLLLIIVINIVMARSGLYREVSSEKKPVSAAEGWRAILDSRYLGLIAVILLLTQLAQPLIDYQFIKTIELAYSDTDARTAYLASFFSTLGLVAIGINLAVTPLVHRYFGVMAGLLAQPLAVTVSSLMFSASPVLTMAAAMKISDRGLSYSINRASKELLYVPVDPVQTYQAKAWIDMFGYRVFKVLGSVIILALTQWSSTPASLGELSLYVVACCVTWIAAIALLSREYRTLVTVPTAA